MKTLRWKAMAMILLALCLGGASANGHAGGAWDANEPSLLIDESGFVGVINGSGNGFITRPEMVTNLFAILIVGVSLLVVALIPSPHQEEGEKTPKEKAEPFVNFRKERNIPRQGANRLTAVENTCSRLSPLSLR